MSKSVKITPGLPAAGHNRSSLELAEIARLIVRKGDPRRFAKRDIELAKGVLAKLPSEAPLPVVVNEAGEILAGHILVEGARKLGRTKLLVIRHAGLSALEEKKYGAAIAQLLTKGSFDPLDLEALVQELEAGLDDFSHLDLGFDNGELDMALALPSDITSDSDEADAVPSVAEAAVTRPGMTWCAGDHRIRCGSATDVADFEALMDGHSAAIAITDPPYGCKIDGFVSQRGRHRDFVEAAGEKGSEELSQFFAGFAENLAASMSKGGLVYLFIDWRSLDLLLRACEPTFGSIIQMCCWTKDRAGMGSFYRSQHELVLVFKARGAKHTNNVQLGRNGRNRSNVWSYPSAASSRSGREGDMLENHPTPKPVEMIADAILDCTQHGDRVLDCFLGSGTTLIAAERTKRVCYAMELDPLYVDVAIQRWQEWTGKDAIDAETGISFDALADAGFNQREQADD